MTGAEAQVIGVTGDEARRTGAEDAGANGKEMRGGTTSQLLERTRRRRSNDDVDVFVARRVRENA